ncbi:hypothetical protein [Microbulbifer rhizosphaerae]|uniref:Uncharacterized protein n=1 Tax=Microbulbifer rhizosphaerae TaxID=1562603 RepID=A0A7W4WBD6_9GAMM|nr:hypothetical protein [Microbulbifer rhizosphaerae]MBB3061170.1 hypothetical protein [Microbulbifer rhizosphaerae]
MGKRTPGLLILSTTVVAIGFFVFRDTFTPSLPGDASGRSSAFEALPSDKTGNTMPDVVEKADNIREHEDAVDDSGGDIADLQARYAEVSDNPDYPQLEARMEAMQERHPGRSFDPEKVVETMARTEAWERVATHPDDLPLTPEQKYDGREFIHFNPLRIETLMPGDTLQIPVWQLGTHFEMRVDRAETHKNGSVTWHGHLENYNESHRVVITVGEGLSLAGIDTPNGHYVLQAHGESGWIASSETLFKRNEQETDMVIPSKEGPENP